MLNEVKGGKMKVPFADLNRLHDEIKAELTAAFEEVLTSNKFIQGSYAQKFEEEWAEFVGSKHAIGCANGTDALELILLGLGIGAGDEVIAPSHTFFATVEAIKSVGATPVLIDVLSENSLLDPALIEDAITSHTKAVMPVHLYGHPVDMDRILEVTNRRGIHCIEDAAQAHGATYKGRRAGNLGGIAAAFSFYPGKNLGALGDAGAVVTNDDGLAERIRALRDHGRQGKYAHGEFGWNMRMDGMQAAFLSVKLKYLPQWLEDRRRVAKQYTEELAGLDEIALLSSSPLIDHAYHLFVVHSSDRDSLQSFLNDQGIQTGVHYPLGCHQQPAWIKTYGKMELPITELHTASCLSLPIFGQMTSAETVAVIKAVHAYCEQRGKRVANF